MLRQVKVDQLLQDLVPLQAADHAARAVEAGDVGGVPRQDERLTTVTAERALIEGGMHRQERKGTVDKVAAAVILQQYLDTLRNIEASHIVD